MSPAFIFLPDCACATPDPQAATVRPANERLQLVDGTVDPLFRAETAFDQAAPRALDVADDVRDPRRPTRRSVPVHFGLDRQLDLRETRLIQQPVQPPAD